MPVVFPRARQDRPASREWSGTAVSRGAPFGDLCRAALTGDDLTAWEHRAFWEASDGFYTTKPTTRSAGHGCD
jgi:hypothetical protein